VEVAILRKFLGEAGGRGEVTRFFFPLVGFWVDLTYNSDKAMTARLTRRPTWSDL
jgi:hypothetical protein